MSTTSHLRRAAQHWIETQSPVGEVASTFKVLVKDLVSEVEKMNKEVESLPAPDPLPRRDWAAEEAASLERAKKFYSEINRIKEEGFSSINSLTYGDDAEKFARMNPEIKRFSLCGATTQFWFEEEIERFGRKAVTGRDKPFVIPEVWENKDGKLERICPPNLEG